MARDEVNIKVSSEVAEAIRLWEAMKKGPEGMANALEDTGKKGKRAADDVSTSFGNMLGKITGITTALGAVKAGWDAASAAQKQYQENTKDATLSVDTMQRKFANQTGATNQQMGQANTRILNIASDRAVTVEQAYAAATQLASSGFSADQASGQSLDHILKLANATNQVGPNADIAGMAGAVINYLQATEQPSTPEAVEKASKAIHGLFKGTDLQASHLAAFAPKAGVIYGQTGMASEQLPVLTQVLDKAGSIDVAGTSMKASLTGLSTAGADKQRTAALKAMGLKPEDVDFSGENFLQVQERMTRGFESVSDSDRKIFAKQLFGQEGMLAGGILFSREGMKTTSERMANVSSGSEFERAYLMNEGSKEAADRRADINKNTEFYDVNYLDSGTTRKNLEAAMKRSGATSLGQWMATTQYDMYNSTLGFTAEDSLQATLGPGNQQAIQGIVGQSMSSLPADIRGKGASNGMGAIGGAIVITLTDQDGVAIPHKSDVSGLSKAK